MEEIMTLGNNILSKENSLENNLEEEIGKKQKGFLESALGQAVNFAMDLGLRALLPEFAENTVINIKDTLFEQGLSEGIKSVISSGIDIGKSAIGIFTGKFENISQVKSAVSKGGIIDTTSSLLDSVIQTAQKNNLIEKNIASVIKKGKDVILNNVSKNIEDVFTKQLKEIEKITKYSVNWKVAYEEKDFSNMEKEYTKLEKSLEKTIPLEETLKVARQIQNLHNLIKNNGQKFNISKLEEDLAEKLV